MDRGSWRLTGYYGIPERSRRREAWNMIRYLHGLSSIPWCFIGDFNDLLSDEDKCGRVEHPSWLLSGFREMVLACNLADIQLEGYPFTWWKSRGTDRAVEERLDRTMVTPNWCGIFPETRLFNCLASISDYSPILLSLTEKKQSKFTHRLKFENAWL